MDGHLRDLSIVSWSDPCYSPIKIWIYCFMQWAPWGNFSVLSLTDSLLGGNFPFWVITSFPKKIYLPLLESQIGKENRIQRERTSEHWLTQSQKLELSRSEIRWQEPALGLLHRCRVQRLQDTLNCFPMPQAGSRMGSRTSWIGTTNHVGSRHMQV